MKSYYDVDDVTIWHGDAPEAAAWLPDDSVDAIMARRLGRRCWGVELNKDYCDLAADRFTQGVMPL